MAELQQVATIEPELILLEGGGVGMLPVGRAVHRGFTALTATTGTDTKSIRLAYPLPNNLVWQLRTWFFAIDTTSDYQRGLFELYYSPTAEGAANSGTQQMDYPLFASNIIRGTAGGTARIAFNFGSPDNGAATSGEWVVGLGRGSGESPFDLLNFNDASAAPTVAIHSTAAPTGVGTARYVLEWLGYTFEQIRSATLWFGLNNRN